MITLTEEEATRILSTLGLLPGNQSFNEMALLVQKIQEAKQPKSEAK